MGIDTMRERHLRQIRMLLGEALFREAPLDEDMKRATDLLLLTAGDKRIACRVRRHKFYQHPVSRRQFTIRSQTRYNARTELDKIRNGWGDYMFYGFESADERKLDAAVILDLDVFRAEHGTLQASSVPNGDGTEFKPYNIDDFSVALVVASFPATYWRNKELRCMPWGSLRQYQQQIDGLLAQNAALEKRAQEAEFVAIHTGAAFLTVQDDETPF